MGGIVETSNVALQFDGFPMELKLVLKLSPA